MRQSTKNAMMLERAERFDEAVRATPKDRSLAATIEHQAKIHAEGMMLSAIVRQCCTPKVGR